MVISKPFLFALHCALCLTILVQAQNQAGFISIDCGSSKSSYTDEQTGITYLSDRSFIESGENQDILSTYKENTDEKQFWNVRSFPDGARNCYSLNPSNGKGTKYLIRARFMYGNYDRESKLPKFNLYIGVDLWDKVVITDFEEIVNMEILHIASSDQIYVCVANIGFGTPFISVLELRPLESGAYESESTTLQLKERYDFGSTASHLMRYKDDPYDRLWETPPINVWIPVNASVKEDSISKDNHEIPFTVMSSALTLNTTSNMTLFWKNQNTSKKYYFCMYFAELVKLDTNQSREFSIYINGNRWYGPFVPKYLSLTTLYSDGYSMPDSDGNIKIVFNITNNSTLPPLINAFEVYLFSDNSGQETYQMDVDAIQNIKSDYELEIENWQGDPCVPTTYMWDGLNCTFNYNLKTRITALNLSSGGLKGKISPSIANLTSLLYLDLSNNTLTGTLPEFLADLKFLRVLNLEGNNLEGPVPPALEERSKNGLLLSVDATVTGDETPPSPKSESSVSIRISSENNIVFVPIVILVGGFLLRFVP